MSAIEIQMVNKWLAVFGRGSGYLSDKKVNLVVRLTAVNRSAACLRPKYFYVFRSISLAMSSVSLTIETFPMPQMEVFCLFSGRPLCEFNRYATRLLIDLNRLAGELKAQAPKNHKNNSVWRVIDRVVMRWRLRFCFSLVSRINTRFTGLEVP